MDEDSIPKPITPLVHLNEDDIEIEEQVKHVNNTDDNDNIYIVYYLHII
jgi:hypothetical protein